MHTLGRDAVIEGFVADAAQIYRDKPLPKRSAFQRSGGPLSALVWLYETTVVYVPPTSKEVLQARFGMPWEHFLALAQAGAIQPVVGHPEHYLRRQYADSLFELQPPSVWARGDELAHAFADAATYWDLAMREVQAEQMAAIDWVQHKFRRHFPDLSGSALAERIAIELRTNFVDLCIFGFEPLARQLAALPDLSWGARRVLELSELVAYPSLMGMGGVPNYGLRTAVAIEAASAEPLWPSAPARRRLGPEAALLVEGLHLRFPGQSSVDDLVSFHRDGMASRLWSALGDVEEQVVQAAEDPDDAVEASAIAQRVISETLNQLNSVPANARTSATRRRASIAADFAIKVGTAGGVAVASHGLLGLDWLTAALAGAGLVPPLWTVRPLSDAIARCEDRLGDLILRRREGDLAVQLWWLSRWSARRYGAGNSR